MVEYEEEISITELPTIDGLVGVFFQTKNVIYIYIYTGLKNIYAKSQNFCKQEISKSSCFDRKKRCACAMCDLNLAGAVRWLQVDLE